LLPLPGCTTLMMHSWQKVCRHSICEERREEEGAGDPSVMNFGDSF
jgi:hypothetical protein